MSALGQHRAMPTPRADRRAARIILWSIAEGTHDARLALGWTQGALGDRAKVSRAMVGAVERGSANPSIETCGHLLDALGVTPVLQLNGAHLAVRRRQRDPVHARLNAYISRRLTAAGWKAEAEVEIGSGQLHGWIDLLAYDPVTHVLLVIEVKSEIHDLGGIDRHLQWYMREAWAAARRYGWRSSRLTGVLALLESSENDERIQINRQYLEAAFPTRARALAGLIDRSTRTSWPAGTKGLVMIDPASRAKEWIKRTRLDGRRGRAPWLDYSSCLRHERNRKPQ